MISSTFENWPVSNCTLEVKQKERDEAEGNKTKENGNYSPQPRLCPILRDHQSVIRNWRIHLISSSWGDRSILCKSKATVSCS